MRAQLVSQRESFDLDRQKGKQIAASERRQTKVTLSLVQAALSQYFHILVKFHSLLHLKKPTVWARQNKGIAQRANNDKRIEEETGGPTLEASRAALQRKAKIYEEMRKRRRYNDSDDDENQLIDFESRPFSDSDGEDDDGDRSDGDDPWVDYEDEFGRTRTVRQSQLPRPRSPSPQLTSEPAYPVFTTLEARKREGSEERETIRYNAEGEIRTKGVGFYTFSKDEDERKAQMEELKRLREQTETARAHTMSVSAKRKQALERNAAKINARRLLLQQKAAPPSASHQQKATIDDESISSFLSSIRNKK